MNANRFWLSLFVLGTMLFMVGCRDESDSRTKHRTLADAAASLRSNAMVDTTWRGHLSWNGNARILKQSDCYLLDREYFMVGLGDGVALRLIFRARQSGIADSIDFTRPVLIDLQLEEDRSDGAYYRAEPPVPDDSDITSERATTFGSTRLQAINEPARSDHPDGVVAEFEFRCS